MSYIHLAHHFLGGALPISLLKQNFALAEATLEHAIQQTTQIYGHIAAANTKVLASTVKSLPYDNDELYASLKAAAYVIERATKDYPDPGFGLIETTIDGKTVSVTEEIVSEKPFYNLLRLNVARDPKKKVPKVLIFPPMSGHHPSFLRDTGNALLSGADVHIVGWKPPQDVPMSEGEFDFEQYVLQAKELIEEMGPDGHILSVCQPNPVVVAALALIAKENPEKQPCSATVMAGPIDSRVSHASALEGATGPTADMFVAAARSVVPAGFKKGTGRPIHMSSYQLLGFMAPNWDSHTQKTLELFWNVQRKTLLEEAVKSQKEIKQETLRDWLQPYLKKDPTAEDSPAFLEATSTPEKALEAFKNIITKQEKFDADYFAVTGLHGKYLDDTKSIVFEEHLLPNGKLVIDGQTVDAGNITCPVHVVEGSKDDISPPGHSKALFWLSEKIQQACYTLVDGVGHYGVFSGSKWSNPEAKTGTVHRVLAFMHDCGNKAGLQYDAAPSEYNLEMPEQYNPDRHGHRPDNYPQLVA